MPPKNKGGYGGGYKKTSHAGTRGSDPGGKVARTQKGGAKGPKNPGYHGPKKKGY